MWWPTRAKWMTCWPAWASEPIRITLKGGLRAAFAFGARKVLRIPTDDPPPPGPVRAPLLAPARPGARCVVTDN